MSDSRRNSQTGWRSGQYHRGSHRGHAPALKLLLQTLAGLALLILPSQAASLLHIRVLEGAGAIHTSGGRSTRGLLVEITDETGRPVEGAAVSFRLPEEGPGGTFARGMRTDILMTAADGRAGVREFLAGRNVGPFQVRVTAVRDSIRAGTVVDQYISEATQTSSRAKAFTGASPGARSGISKKWVIWLAIGGGAIAAALVAGSSGAASPGSVTGPPVPVVPPPTIGVPVFTVGRPQ